ncbi:hypothetical protein DNTS_024157 [Danionella cerebrum]|uniref:long-chain-fatty-acid--CoA ligase n=1 Tax=Danionella cerebrum TaxID=2873325 RepID=A0A553RIG7_9TELE|nr:hypothetical protein DNTS_024157 [Danionella translucida]
MLCTLLPLTLILLILLLLLLSRLCPLFWTDVLYQAQLLRILFQFVLRRRRSPVFLALDRFLEQVQSRPNQPFIIFENRSFSFRDADRESNLIANALRWDPGLTSGDTVLLFMQNRPEIAFCWLALAKLGCACALLNSNMRSHSLTRSVRCVGGARALITSEDLQGALAEVYTDLQQDRVSVFLISQHLGSSHLKCVFRPDRCVFRSDRSSVFRSDSESSDEPVPASLRANVRFTSPAVYIYTSGTTGLPKAAVITQSRLLAALSVLPSNGVTDKDVIYVTLPLYHTSGFLLGLLGAVETGCSMVLRTKFSASCFWDECEAHRVTIILYIGEILRYLCNTPRRDPDRVQGVRLAIGNGLRADVWQEFIARFGGIEVREFYASTEGNVGFINYAGKIGAAGRVNFLHRKLFPYALIAYDTEQEQPIRNAAGLCVEVPKGQTGLLVSRITHTAPFTGYALDEAQSEKKRLRDVFQKGDVYFNSGDLLRIDADGFIYFQDRVGDTFRWKGENVATTEVSDVLGLLEFIEEANVYGVCVPGHEGRIGMAAVKLKDGREFDGERVFGHVCRLLPGYARPRFIRIQRHIEVTATFKQLKVKLAKAGFDPSTIHDPLYFLSETERSYITLTRHIYQEILALSVKL